VNLNAKTGRPCHGVQQTGTRVNMNYGKPFIARRMWSDADADCASDRKGGIYPFIEDTSDSTNNRGYELTDQGVLNLNLS
jgi:hypothetical protein